MQHFHRRASAASIDLRILWFLVRKKDVKIQAFKVHLGCKYQDHWFRVLIMLILDETLNTNH